MENFYYQISQREFDYIISSPDIYSFPERYIEFLRINNFIKNIKVIDAQLYSSMSSEWNSENKSIWFISDDYGLDKSIESDHVTIHNNRYASSYFISDFGYDDSVRIERFTLRISIFELIVDLIMCNDEWFLACWENEGKLFLYKCDQFEGLSKLLNHLQNLTIQI